MDYQQPSEIDKKEATNALSGLGLKFVPFSNPLLCWKRFPSLCILIFQIIGIVSGYKLLSSHPSIYSDETILTEFLLPCHFFILIAGLLFILLKSNTCKILGLLLLTLFSGLSYLNIQWVNDPADLRILLKEKEKLNATIRGEIISYPIVQKSTGGPGYFWRSTLQVQKIRWNGDKLYTPAHGKILVTVNGEPGDKFAVGSIAEFYGPIGSPMESIDSADFDYKKYLANREIYFIQKVRSVTNCSSHGKAFGLFSQLKYTSAKLHDYVNKTLSYGFSKHDENQAVIKAIVLGDRADLLPETKEQFKQSGTTHLFSVSGLHVAIIAGLVTILLHILLLPKPLIPFIVTGSVWLYTFTTGASSPTLRASLMLTALLLGNFFQRPTIPLNSIGFAGVIILLFSPSQALSASFQLSFTIVLSLLLFLPVTEKLFNEINLLPRKDPFLIEGVEPIFAKLHQQICIAILLSVLTSFYCWVSAIPITIHYFKFLSFGTVFINLFVVCLAAPVLLLSCLSCLFGICSSDASTVCNILLNKISRLMQFFCTEGNGFFGIIPINTPWPLISWILFYVGLFLFFSGFLFKKKNLIYTFIYLIFCGLSVYCTPQNSSALLWNISFLPAEDGSAIVIHNHLQNKTLLVDTGNKRVAQKTLQPYLKYQHIDANPVDIILTHGDVQHIGGLDALTNKLNINKIYINGLKTRSPYMKRYADYPNAYTFWESDSIEIINTSDNHVTLKALHPTPDDKELTRSDQGCIVLKLESENDNILFVGDLEPDGQQLLMDRFNSEVLQSDILVTGEPKSEWWFRTGFLKAVNPKKIIICSTQQSSINRFQKESPLGEGVEVILLDRIYTISH